MLANIVIASIFLFGFTQGAPLHGTGACVSDCKGKPNGDYQSCLSCNVYATCSNGYLYDNRPCAMSHLVWDDSVKKCLYTSTTCSANAIETGSNDVTADVDICVSDCSGKPNGDYQSCIGCNVYATCSNERLYDSRPCPAGLVWDDNNKRCEWWSQTCSSVSAEGVCVSSCKGKPDGDYQSCLGCHVYATCSNELLYDSRPCPADLVWDDHKKRCEFISTTCIGDNNSSGSDSEIIIEAGDTGNSCISSCEGLVDGDYQSCEGCGVYASCTSGGMTDNRPCPSGLVWDDTLKRCAESSTTCSEPDGSGSA